MKTLFFLVVSTFVFSVNPSAAGGRYELLKGGEYEVCRAYESYLNSFQPVRPMICNRPGNLGNSEIQKPIWSPLDIESHLHLIEERVRQSLSENWKLGKSKEQIDKIKEIIEKRILKKEDLAKKGSIKIFSGIFDINNDGMNENVLFFESSPEVGGCTEKNKFYQTGSAIDARNIFVADHDNRIVNVDNRSLNLFFDVFFYKGRTFLDNWGAIGSWSGGRGGVTYTPGLGGGGVTVYEPTADGFGGATSILKICEIGYHGE